MKNKLFNQLCEQIELPNKESNELSDHIAKDLITNISSTCNSHYSIIHMWKIIYTIYSCWLFMYRFAHKLSYRQIMRKNGLIFATEYGSYESKIANQNWIKNQIRRLNLSPKEYVILVFSGCINAKKQYIGTNRHSIIDCYFVLFLFAFPIVIYLLSMMKLIIVYNNNDLSLLKLTILLLLILFQYHIFLLIKTQHLDSNKIVNRLVS